MGECGCRITMCLDWHKYLFLWIAKACPTRECLGWNWKDFIHSTMIFGAISRTWWETILRCPHYDENTSMFNDEERWVLSRFVSLSCTKYVVPKGRSL